MIKTKKDVALRNENWHLSSSIVHGLDSLFSVDFGSIRCSMVKPLLMTFWHPTNVASSNKTTSPSVHFTAPNPAWSCNKKKTLVCKMCGTNDGCAGFDASANVRLMLRKCFRFHSKPLIGFNEEEAQNGIVLTVLFNIAGYHQII